MPDVQAVLLCMNLINLLHRVAGLFVLRSVEPGRSEAFNRKLGYTP